VSSVRRFVSTNVPDTLQHRSSNSPADYFGRRFNIALLTLFMVAACLVEMFAKDWQTWTAAKLCEWRCLFGSRLYKITVQLADNQSRSDYSQRVLRRTLPVDADDLCQRIGSGSTSRRALDRLFVLVSSHSTFRFGQVTDQHK
jgi:hypothetical protein